MILEGILSRLLLAERQVRIVIIQVLVDYSASFVMIAFVLHSYMLEKRFNNNLLWLATVAITTGYGPRSFVLLQIGITTLHTSKSLYNFLWIIHYMKICCYQL